MGVILVVAAFFRLYQLDSAPPGLQYDEAYNGMDALRVLQGERPMFFEGNNGREPLFIYLVALSVALVGKGVLAVRLVSVVMGLAVVAGSYFLVRRLYGVPVALISAGLLSVSFWHVLVSRWGYETGPLLFLEVLALLLFWEAIDKGNNIAALGGGVALGASLYTYPSSRFLPIAFLVFVVVSALLKPIFIKERGRSLIIFFAAALVALIPLGQYAVTHSQSFLLRTSQTNDIRYILEKGDFGPFLGDSLNALAMFSLRGDPQWMYNFSGRPLFDPVTSLLFYAGVGLVLARFRDPRHALALITVGVMLVPIAITGQSPHLVRAVGIIPFLYLFPALGILWLWQRVAIRFVVHGQKMAVAFLALLFLATAASTYYHFFQVWAKEPQVLQEYDADLVDGLHFLQRYNGSERIFLATEQPNHPAVAFLAPHAEQVRQFTGFSRFTGRSTLVLPAAGDILYLFPRWMTPSAEQMASFASMQPVATGRDMDGKPSFVAYRLDSQALAAARSVTPQKVLNKDLGGEVRLVGYVAPSEIRSGEELPLILYWQPLGRAKDDYRITFSITDDRGQRRSWRWLTGDDSYPPGLWEDGDLVITKYGLGLYPGLPRGEGWVTVRFAPPRSEAGGLSATLGPVRWLTNPTPPPLQFLGARSFTRARIADDLLLLGWNKGEGNFQPGDRVPVTLFWQALQKGVENYRFAIQWVDGEGRLWDAAPRLLAGGVYPPGEWAPGEVVRDDVASPLSVRMPPDRYQAHLKVFLGERLVSRLSNLFSIQVVPGQREYREPSLPHSVYARMGDDMELLGYRLSPEGIASPGELKVTLYWRALKKMERDYTIFLHLLDDSGRLTGQVDGPPRAGQYPTSRWAPEEVVEEERYLPLPQGMTSARYQLRVGVYCFPQMERLPISDNRGNSLGTSLLLQEIPEGG